MNFQDRLNQELKQVATYDNDNDVVYPNSKLKHDPLYFSKDTNQLMVRILPDVDEEHFFAEGYQEFWINAKNKSNKDLSLNVTMPIQLDPSSKIVQKITQWQAENRVPNRFGSGPRKRFVLNVVQVGRDANGQLAHEVDEDGNLVVRMLTVPQTVYQDIITSLQNENLAPANGDPYSFIGESEAFPVDIRKEGTGTNTKYLTQVYPNMPLGPLPANWREQAEDLTYQVTPTEEYNEDYLNYMIAVVDGKEDEYNASRNGGDNNGNAGQGEQQSAPTFGGTTPSFGAPAQNNTPDIPDNAVNNAPNNNAGGAQQPQGQAPQFGQGNAGGAQQPQATQPTQNTAPSTPEQNSAPASTGGDNIPNVDDMLADIKSQFGN